MLPKSFAEDVRMACQQAVDATSEGVVKTYNHAFTLAFEVPGSICSEGEDVTVEQLVAALRKRIDALVSSDELLEAIGAPFDSFCETD